MFRNYLLVAARNLQRHKIISGINVLGLAIGISASLVIFLIVRYSYSFDHFEPGADRIYRVISDFKTQGNPGHTRGTQAPLADVVKKELTGTDLTAVFRYYNPARQAIQKSPDRSASKFPAQRKIIFADAGYLHLIPFQWLAGSPSVALDRPGQVVLDESRAQLYFPNTPYGQVLGSTIIYDDTITAQVTGVVRDLDKQGNTDFTFHEFISLPTLLDNQGLRRHFFWDDWGGTTSDQQLFVRLSKGTRPETVNAQLSRLTEKYLGEDQRKNNYTWKFGLQPLSDIHFNRDYGILDSPVADKDTLYALMAIAAFLLALACINFINLATAQATTRAREVGIRKTMGSSRGQLVFQFLSETLIVTAIAGVISLLMLRWLLRLFADYMPFGFHFSFADTTVYLFLAILVAVVSALAGTYPSLVLSSWNATAVLKSRAPARKSGMRQTLTVSQFVIAQFFIMGTWVVAQQIRYMLNADLGFRKEAVISFSLPDSDTSLTRRQALLNEVEQLPAVQMASLASDVPHSGHWWHGGIDYKDGKKDIHTVAELKAGDDNYLTLFHIPLIAGRAPLHSDTMSEVVINQVYLHQLGFQKPEDALGKSLAWNGPPVPIVGVMRNFHAHPLDDAIEPMAFFHMTSESNTIAVALQPAASGRWPETFQSIEKAYKRLYPDGDFQYNFLDESINDAYQQEQKTEHLLTWATGLTIFISCLGLLGLVMYTTTQRTKEIGIRKVLGATISQVIALLSKNLVALLGIAFAIAMPLSWWATHSWLHNFAFQTSVGWWMFPLCGLVMALIALATISIQTFRAATANPVDSLRTE